MNWNVIRAIDTLAPDCSNVRHYVAGQGGVFAVIADEYCEKDWHVMWIRDKPEQVLEGLRDPSKSLPWHRNFHDLFCGSFETEQEAIDAMNDAGFVKASLRRFWHHRL